MMSIKVFVFGLAFWLTLGMACSSKPGLTYEPPGGGIVTPEEPGDPHPSEKVIISIADLKGYYNLTPRQIVEDVSIQGVVVGNDWCASFYKTLVVEDASGGIEIKLDETPLLSKYYLGTTVTVRCNGLTLGDYGGLLQLGWASSDPQYETAYVPEHLVADYVVITDHTEKPLIPAVLTIPQLLARHVSCLVSLEGVQFVEEERGKRYTEGGVDTDRHLTDVAGNRLIVRTGAHATFADYRLPNGSGYIEGVLSYFNGRFQLKITNDTHVVMDNPRFSIAPEG